MCLSPYGCAIALGEIGDRAAQEALERTAEYDSDPRVRAAAKDALRKIRGTESCGSACHSFSIFAIYPAIQIGPAAAIDAPPCAIRPGALA
ncbi:MAG: hypothetical protein A2W31_00420 [Planctomycetes bacterium RBG_16_64_10]|nr:MAG: hypothetical protein A2W31_00420 [Planctomycetes bacterium RBG_16_64_10]